MKIFSSEHTSLKICGVRLECDAEELVRLGVDAVGFNFWPKSKRYLRPEEGVWTKGLAGRILRVGVFVNEESDLPFRLFGEGMIDVVQLHGDETPQQAHRYVEAGVPVIKALGIKERGDLSRAALFQTDAVLLDAYAPQVFGGTGETFDWSLAAEFKRLNPTKPMILAGGITADNAALAIVQSRPDAIDVASGAEVQPGVKDFQKVKSLLAACREAI
jgi:phosphoribosylanthranilate isomerase